MFIYMYSRGYMSIQGEKQFKKYAIVMLLFMLDLEILLLEQFTGFCYFQLHVLCALPTCQKPCLFRLMVWLRNLGRRSKFF